jgi:hypothetical protein
MIPARFEARLRSSLHSGWTSRLRLVVLQRALAAAIAVVAVMANLTPAFAGSTPSAAAEAPSSNPPVDVYVSVNNPPYGYSNSAVLVPAGGGAPVAIPGFVDNFLTALAVDSQGDVYMADTTQWNSIEEFPVGQGGAFNSIPCGCVGVSGLALDTKGDVYFVSDRVTAVEKITPGNDFQTDVTAPTCGVESGAGCNLNDPSGLAVDPQGDVFVANTGNNQVLEIPANGGPEIQVGTGLMSPVSVAVDAQGDVFVGELGGVVEIPTNGGSQRTLFTTSYQVEVAADLAGDVYLTDPAEGGLLEIPAGGGPAITLASSESGFIAVPPGALLPQSIAFTSTPPPDATMHGPTYDVSASGGASGNPVVFTSATPAVCTVSGSTVSFVGVGACTIDANQAGAAAYAAADEQSQTIEVIDNDLALMNMPANLTVNATSPQGAVATYTPPTVVDEDTPLPTVTCSPASVNTFAIGLSTVTCTVSATGDTNSPVSKSFTVNVLGGAAQLANLQLMVTGVGPESSLADKVSQAQADVAANNTEGGCGVLAAFIHEVNAQASKSISKSTAASLIPSATRIRAVLGC